MLARFGALGWPADARTTRIEKLLEEFLLYFWYGDNVSIRDFLSIYSVNTNRNKRPNTPDSSNIFNISLDNC